MSAAPSVPESSATAEAALAGLLYERYSSRILGYCRSRLRSREEAEDAVQHTFLNAYRSLRGGVVPHAEAAWLFKIAANVCHERRRSAWRRSRIEAVSDDGELRDAVAPPTSAHDELAGLADALAELTPNQRRAILLREWQGLSYREIAAELETTEAAVETLLFRARHSLARKLDRRRARAGLDLGSLLAWIQSLAGGAAVKVAAATVVTAASVTVATPALRSHASRAPCHAGEHSCDPCRLCVAASTRTRSGTSGAACFLDTAAVAETEHDSWQTARSSDSAASDRDQGDHPGAGGHGARLGAGGGSRGAGPAAVRPHRGAASSARAAAAGSGPPSATDRDGDRSGPA